MELQLLLQNNLAIHFYYSNESIKDGKIIVENLYLVFSGFPQLIEKDFFKDKVKENVAFMNVYYYGSYYSGGKFSFKNCQKSVKDAIELAFLGRGTKTYDNKIIEWVFKKLSIIGNSFGASPILTSDLDKNKIEKIILISPLIFVNKHDIEKIYSPQEIEKLSEFNNNFLGFMKRGYKNIYKGVEKGYWDKYFNGSVVNSKIKLKDNFPSIIVFHGEDDPVVNYKSSVYFQKQYQDKVTLNLVSGVGHDFKVLFGKFN